MKRLSIFHEVDERKQKHYQLAHGEKCDPSRSMTYAELYTEEQMMPISVQVAFLDLSRDSGASFASSKPRYSTYILHKASPSGSV